MFYQQNRTSFAARANFQEHNLMKVEMLQAQAYQKPDKPEPCGLSLDGDCKQNPNWHHLCPANHICDSYIT